MHRKSSIGRALAHWLACLLCIACGAAYADRKPDWTLLELPQGTAAQDMNNAGDVVGSEFIATTSFGCCSHSFLLRNGVLIDISPAGIANSKAVAVNANGTALIQGDGASIFVTRDGATTQLPFLGTARGINNEGGVVGSFGVGFGEHAYLFDRGMLQDLGTLGGHVSEAFAVNDSGIVVGNSRLADNATTHAFVFQDGVMHDIDTLGGFSSIAFDVNEHGVVVGGLTDASFQNTIAFIWDANGGMRKLVDGPLSVALAINNRGDVVGTTANGSFLLSDGALTALESIPAVKAAGITRIIPSAINDRGWITGTAFKAAAGESIILMPR
jgi:probable HAF family extracellular repeat protein